MTSSQATVNATLHHCPLWEILLCCSGTLTVLIRRGHVAMRHEYDRTGKGAWHIWTGFFMKTRVFQQSTSLPEDVNVKQYIRA